MRKHQAADGKRSKFAQVPTVSAAVINFVVGVLLAASDNDARCGAFLFEIEYSIGREDKLIFPKLDSCTNILYCTINKNMYDILYDIHISIEQGGKHSRS